MAGADALAEQRSIANRACLKQATRDCEQRLSNSPGYGCAISRNRRWPCGSKIKVAQQGLEVGRLRCNVSAGLGLVITSSKEMSCVFTSARGHHERYYGTIRKFGL